MLHSPVSALGMLLLAGTMSSTTDEKEPQTPSYDKLLKDMDKDGDGKISRAEGEKGFAGFFDNQDANENGFVEHEEFEMIMKLMSEGKNGDSRSSQVVVAISRTATSSGNRPRGCRTLRRRSPTGASL